ncbi:MAG TPA: hypothetical protein VGO11_15715 [Chthoniobacteraceae bacterium]|jgi:hypothetical protein|nr:hypothetical protein [Chthoniobacteraceae bacterium]
MKIPLRLVFLSCLALPVFAGLRDHDQSDFAIVSAGYGTDEKRIEVADVLRPHIAHQGFFLHAGWGLGNPDPAPGTVKDVEIVYVVNGLRKTARFGQHEDIILPPPRGVLTIVSALYGLPDRQVDATEAVRAAVVDGAVHLPPKWGLGRVDPAAGKIKTVEITYLHDGVAKTARFEQSQELNLP